MPNAISFTQDAIKLLLLPDPPLSKKDADNRVARLIGAKPDRVGRWRRGERCPSADELLAIISCIREQEGLRRKRFDEMERKTAAALPPVGGEDIGPLGDVVRREGDKDR